MPWMSIIMWLITFLLSSSKEGTSTAKAALIASGAALGTYMLADPANPDNYFGITQGKTGTTLEPGSPAAASDGTSGVPSVEGTTGAQWTTLGNSAINAAKDVITNPNTAGTIVAGGAVAGGIFSSKNLPWLLAAGAAFLLLK